MDTAYASGDWHVTAGNESAFIGKWKEFTGWSAQTLPGARSFVLLRDDKDPLHFVSVGTWEDKPSLDAWRADPGFAPRFTACADLCEKVYPSDYTQAAQVTPDNVSR